MGLVDTAKRIKLSLTDALVPQRVLFHHVPKCGGTSVGRALRRRYILSQSTVTPEASYRAFELFTGGSDREQMLIDVLDLREQMMIYLLFEDIRCVSLHVRFSEVAFDKFRHKYKFVTLLRDPVDRFISHYYWSHPKKGAHAWIEEELEEFVETKRAKRLGATYVEYFSGLPKEADFSSPIAVAAAQRNLGRLDVVGRLDRLKVFEQDLSRELGVRISIGHENKAPSVNGERKVSSDVMEKVRALCAPDIAVWNSLLADSQLASKHR